MLEPNNIIEKLKTIILVVLFFSTILLLSFFWRDTSFESRSVVTNPIEVEVPSAQNVIKPYRVTINFGAENYTVIPPNIDYLWYNSKPEKASMVKEINNFGKTENVLLQEITRDQYSEVMSYRSIRAEFSYYMMFTDFCKKYEINVHQSYSGIEAISEIGYSEQSPDSLLVFDGKNEKYYRLVADSEYSNFKDLIKSIEEEGYENYYPLNTLLGVGGSTLIPPNPTVSLKAFSYQQEVYTHQTDKINEIAQSFFGDSFDFVRKITEENGTIIYMYGFGQKVVVVNPDGSFEYKEEQLNSNTQDSYFSSLDTALAFVSSHGSWESLGGSKMSPYLKDVIIDPDKKKGYRFIFGMEIGGVGLHYETNDPIIIEVTWGQVTYYKRSMLDYDKKEVEGIQSSPPVTAYSPVNLIAQNYEYIYKLLQDKEALAGKTDGAQLFEDVANEIEDMEIGYLKQDQSKNQSYEIFPVWIVKIDGINIYFDIFEAVPLGHSPK